LTNLLNVQNLKAWYADSQVLFGIDLKIESGQMVALLGRNGMGKSTTIKSLCGIMEKVEGQVFFQGKSIINKPSYEIAKLGFGLVPEGRRVFTNLTVYENLICSAKKGYWSIDKLKLIFPRLNERLSQMASSLSGGEQQMLSIGRALMTNPKLLILDEATEGLSPNLRNEIWKVISEIKKEGISIILIDKYLHKIKAQADYLYILSRGKNVWEGNSKDLNDNIVKKFLSV
jgi:branched-chain amino acid transport system ATP-binding protein